MLPEPGNDARLHSEKLAGYIARIIEDAGGWIDFARYMELALYAPGLGYYAAGAQKFGASGDFVTAPEMTPLFGHTLARQIAAILSQSGGDVLELGAGSGRLAADVLHELAHLDALPGRYFILEVSADLAARQRAYLFQESPELAGRVVWLSELPATFTGLILGNEILDALPVHVLHWHEGQVFERGVTTQAGHLAWSERAGTNPARLDYLRTLPTNDGYMSEVSLAVPGLIRTLGRILKCGAMLFIDYGFPREEYYHPQRHMGTLRAHYRHHALDDPFYLPGLCDLTAHVDFSAVAEAGTAIGLQLAGYTSQANFLLNAGVTDLLLQTSPAEAGAYLRQSNAVGRLVSPAEMGELFKVIALTRALDAPLMGFMRGDRSHRL